MIGETLGGKYEIVRPIGEGGMGAVYEAVNLGVGRRVAVKLINADNLAEKATHVARFHREAKLAGGIETRHICQVYDTGEDERGRPYMVMELMRGSDVADKLKETGPFSPDVALAVIVQACRGLQKAHDAGIIHRDIKPANLFLHEEEDGEITVKLLDFGIAKVRGDLLPSEGSDTALTRTGALMGSPLYMSPEQARGKGDIDFRTDLFSLGVVLYRMLCGRAPFQDIDAFGDLLMSICTEPSPPLQRFAPWVDAAVTEVAHRALLIPREARYQTATDMMAAADALVPPGFRLRKEHFVPLGAEARNRIAPLADGDTRLALSATQHAVANTQADDEVVAPSAGRGRRYLFLGTAAVLLAVGGGFFVVNRTGEVQKSPPSLGSASVDPVDASDTMGGPSSRSEEPAGSARAEAKADELGAVDGTATEERAGDARPGGSAAIPSSSVAPPPPPVVAPPPPPRVVAPPPPSPRPTDDLFGGRK